MKSRCSSITRFNAAGRSALPASGLYLLLALLVIVPSPSLGQEEAPAGQEAVTGSEGEIEEEGEETTVAVLLDDSTTKDMHDDSTLLRDVVALDDQALVFFDALRFWVGGAVQYDYYSIDGIYNHESHNDSEEGGNFRRLEVIGRAQLFDWGELKAQYDLDAGIFRDLYLRWVSERPETPITITIGNQKEPISLDNLSGNKFEMAQERAAPSHAFGSWRSKGVRLHKAFELGADERKFDLYEDRGSFITTSIGVFTKDLDASHDTDVAVTGRVTGGVAKGQSGVHVGFATSYREGEYDRVSFRPEVREANRIILARPDANTQGIVAGELAWNRGRMHLQAEAYYTEYRGRIDGYGGGSYVQGGWFLTQDARQYNARWGIQGAPRPSGNYAIELFARLSHTRGDDDVEGWNDYKSLTLGGNFYYRKARGSLNILYGESREPINDETDGLGFVIRAQYLF